MQCLIEGGNILQSAFLNENLVHELHIYRGNIIMGQKGLKWNSNFFENLSYCPRYELESVEPIGNDIYSKYHINPNMTQSYIESALADLKQGKPVILMDDHDRENEGDLVIGAEFVTSEMVTFFKKYTTGILCIPMTEDRAVRLNLPRLREGFTNEDIRQTPFTISCDAKQCHTGVSSEERAITIQTLVSEDTAPQALSRPGHIFPLIGARAGLFERQGHTEGSLELCKLAGIKQIAMIGELTNDDGSMMRLQDCKQFAATHNITLVLMNELLHHIKHYTILKDRRALSSCVLELENNGKWTLVCYDSGDSFYPHRVLIKGDIYKTTPVLTRIHSECFTGDVLHSLHCDCGDQLKLALHQITAHGSGLIILPAHHEGRGIGLTNKIRAYRLMVNTKIDTYEANHQLGYHDDERNYQAILSILKDLKVTQIDLLTNNPKKVEALKSVIHKVIPLSIPPNEHNIRYLDSKKKYETIHQTPLQQKITTVNDTMNTITLTEKVSIAIIMTYWNEELLQPYCTDIESELRTQIPKITIKIFKVPGSFEIPFCVSSLQDQPYDAIICLGVIIKGDTAHFEYISSSVIEGLMKLQITGKIPIINGILNTYNRDQALERLNIASKQSKSIALSALRMIEIDRSNKK